MKLKKSVKAKWVKALRSGKYQQGTYCLKYYDYWTHTDKFCCLGVACDLGLAKKDPSHGEFVVEDDFLYHEAQHKLANYNDGGKSFKWIASYIERYL